ncbi:MAG TPA: N-glycosylase/DNA lyase [Acidilobales archaeon]|nr:N-glycosylase/DNA lyase [Acidilobales archaeon]
MRGLKGDQQVMIDIDAIEAVARVMKEFNVGSYVDTFTDPRYYPSPSDDPENVVRYFIFMVAIDHRLSRPRRAFEGFIDSEFYHGADALYRLGMIKYGEDPDFFSPLNMSKITVDDVRKWLSLRGVNGKVIEVWDADVRTALLRDLGIKLLRLHEGKVLNLIDKANSRIKQGNGGLVNLLKVFKAYEDPVEKKAYLLIKFIARRGLFKYKDPENEEVPVDNHLSRIAIRLGIIKLPSDLLSKVKAGQEFTYEEDVRLRLMVRRAFKEVSIRSGISPLILDDFLWMFGRKCCKRDCPSCSVGCDLECRKFGWCGSGGCLFEGVCEAHRRSEYLPEHSYLNTWYY